MVFSVYVSRDLVLPPELEDTKQARSALLTQGPLLEHRFSLGSQRSVSLERAGQILWSIQLSLEPVPLYKRTKTLPKCHLLLVKFGESRSDSAVDITEFRACPLV